MTLLVFILFVLVTIGLVLWGGLSAQKLITKAYEERRSLEMSIIDKLIPASDAIEEVLTLNSEGKVKEGIGVGERAFRSMLLFQVGTPPLNATVDATMIGLRYLEKFGNCDEKSEEILYNAKKSMPDFLRNHLDSDIGGAKHHVGSYPTIYGCYFFIEGVKWYYGIKHENRLTYKRLVEFVGGHQARRFLDFIINCRHEFDEAEAFSEIPGGDIGTVTTGGVTQILLDLVLNDDFPPPLDDLGQLFLKVAKFVDQCEVRVRVNGHICYGFANSVEVKIPQTGTTRHALKTYTTIYNVGKTVDSKLEAPRLNAASIAGFLGSCRENHGFSRVRGEPASPLYTGEVICCSNYYPFKNNGEIKEIKGILNYEGILKFLGLCFRNGGFGFGKISYPNIYAARSAGHILSNLRMLYEPSERDQSREDRLSERVYQAILSHFDTRTGKAIGYKPIYRDAKH